MNKPTICQVLHSLVVGGAEVLATQLARQLQDRYRFVFACLDGLGRLGEQMRDEGFTIEVLERRPGVDFRCMKRLARFWRQEQVDLVHAHQYTPFFYAAAARGIRRGPPVFFTEHGRFFPDYPRKKRILFNRLTLRRCDRVVCVGECLRRALVANEGIPAARIGVIYNGVNFQGLAAPTSDRAAVRAELGVGPDDVLAVQVARLDPVKDHATAVRALDRVARQQGNVHLAIAGEGPQRAAVEAEIQRLRVQNCVHLLGFYPDLASLLHAADLFLLTSVNEGTPVTIIEAMATGLPVVSTDVGGVTEIVRPQETGFLAPAGDDSDLADAIVRLAQDAGLRREMGERGCRRAREAFSEERMHADYQAVYEEMLSA